MQTPPRCRDAVIDECLSKHSIYAMMHPETMVCTMVFAEGLHFPFGKLTFLRGATPLETGGVCMYFCPVNRSWFVSLSGL